MQRAGQEGTERAGEPQQGGGEEEVETLNLSPPAHPGWSLLPEPINRRGKHFLRQIVNKIGVE